MVWREARLPVEVLQIASHDAAGQLRAHFAIAQRSLDLRHAPMMALAGTEDVEHGRWLGLLRFHHLVNDAVSVQVLLGELRAVLSGTQQALATPVPYRNYVALSGAEARQAQHEVFLRALLAGVEAPPSLPGMPTHDVSPQTLESLEQPLSGRLNGSLRRLARQHDVGLPSLLNSLPLRLHLAGRSVAQALGDTQGALAALLEHEDAPLSLAQQCSGLPAGVPLFNSLINFRHGLTRGQSTPRAAVLRTAGRTTGAAGGLQRYCASPRTAGSNLAVAVRGASAAYA